MSKPTRANKLTPKEEKFTLNILNGMSQRQAYKDAYDAENMKDESIDVKACNLFNSNKIRLRYNELLEEMKDKFIMTASAKRKLLKEIMENQDNHLTDRLKALDIDNKMAGEYIDKHEIVNDEIVIYNRTNADN